MTHFRTLILSIPILLAALSSRAAAQERGWYSEVGCEKRVECKRTDPQAAFHLQFETSILRKQYPATYHDYLEAHPGGELFLNFPLARHVGFMMFGRVADSERLVHMFLGPSYQPTHGIAIGIGPGVAVKKDHENGPHGILALSANVHSEYLRAEGDLGGNLTQYRAAANATFWPIKDWVGLGLMLQDDTWAYDESLIGLRIELEYRPVNFFAAMTGGLRGREEAGMLFGLRLIPWERF